MQENEQFKSKKQQRKWSKKVERMIDNYPKVYKKKEKRIKKVDFKNNKCYND